MADYVELVKDLLHCATSSEACTSCNRKNERYCQDNLHAEAADAITELVQKFHQLEQNSIPKHDAEIIISEIAKPKWTAVEDALPDESGRYLVFLSHYDFESEVSFIAYGFTAGDLSYVTEMFFDKAQMLWNDNATSQSFNAVLSAVNRNEVQAVTHWMPLPQEPEEKNDDI